MNISKKASIIALALVLMSLAISTAVSAAGEELAFWGMAGLACIVPIIIFIIWIVIAIWVYKDAEKRGSSGALWLIIVIITGIIGLIIWLVVRPPIGGKKEGASGRVCPACGRPIPMDAQVCPYCGKNFKE